MKTMQKFRIQKLISRRRLLGTSEYKQIERRSRSPETEIENTIRYAMRCAIKAFQARVVCTPIALGEKRMR